MTTKKALIPIILEKKRGVKAKGDEGPTGGENNESSGPTTSPG